MKISPSSNAPQLVGWILLVLIAACTCVLAPATAWSQATQVDIATDLTDPSNLNDFEPSIAVNPANPLQIAVVTFSETWSSGNAPVWRSDDGGKTWRKVTQIPQPSSLCGPGDQKIAFDAVGNLYVAELGFDCITGAAQDFVYRQAGAEDDPLTVGASYGDDQPHVDVDKGSGSGCLALVYSPWLNFKISPERSTVSNSTSGGSSMTDVAAGNNTFPNRTTRIALSSDGKAYIIYKSREGAAGGNFENAHFYVRRSDDCGATWTANGGTSGVSVHGTGTVQTWFTSSWGNASKGPTARARSSDAWVAVDPTSGDVYAAYVSKDSSGFGQIYVARSTTQGTSWLAPVRVTDGTHHSAYPEIAVTTNGTVGVLYIDYDDSGTDILYRHHFSRSFDQGAHWADKTLQSMDPKTVTFATTSPPLWGDYEGLTAAGKIFYGVYTGQSTGRTITQLDPIFFSESGVPADLAITKTAPGSVVAGGQLTYSLNVTNNGPSDATNVVVTDMLPGGTTFLTSSIPCTAGGTCTIGNLANGASASFTITVRVSASLLSNLGASATNITNTATVKADQFDPDSRNNTATASTLVTESADMALTKTCKPDTPAQAGTSAFCDIQVANLGLSDAQNVVVTDAIVSNASFTVTSVTGTAASCTTSIGSPTSATVTCNLLTVPAGGGTTIHVTFTSNNPGDINDTATVRSTTPDPVAGNNSATGRVSFFASADLTISKTATPNPVVAGTNVTYTIAVSNAGPSSASNVVVKDTLPSEVRVLTVTPSVGSCTAGIPGNPLQPLTCTIGSMATAGSATITVMARVDPSVPDGTVINNNAIISSATLDPNNGNNSATAAVTVNARSDLAITKTSDQASYKPSSVVTYTVSVTNNGPSNALAVIVTDNLPDIQQALYQSDTGSCVANASTPTILTCNLGSMPVGTSKSFNIYELIHGSQGNVSNTASVTSSTTDPNVANNTSVRTVTIGH
jgi:uncharacterized repeat protein (TIGR01451 family)